MAVYAGKVHGRPSQLLIALQQSSDNYLPNPPAFDAADQRVAAKQIELVTMADYRPVVSRM